MSGDIHDYRFKADGPVLQRYIDDPARICFIMGPLGSGKTFGSCWKLFNKMIAQRVAEDGVRYSRWYAVRNTYADLMTTTVKDWLGMFEPLGRFTGGGLEPPTHRLEFNLEDGTRVNSELVFIALDREDSVKKLRGSQVTGFWLNEIKELNKSVVDMADLRHGRYPGPELGGCSWHGMIGDTNAPDTDHWYHNLAEVVRPLGWSFHRQQGGVVNTGVDIDGRKIWSPNSSAENLKNLPENYYINGLQGKSDDWISVNLANEYGFVTDGKPIFPEYTDGIHCRPVLFDPNIPLHIGVDFGLTPAAGFGQRSAMGQVRLLDELVCEDMGALQFGELLYEKIQADYPQAQIGGITCDPSGDNRDAGNSNSTAIKMLNSQLRGLSALPAHTNDFTIRREALAAPMLRLIDGQPGFLIDPKCVVTRKGLQGGYNYRRLQVAGDSRYEDRPNKNKFSHPVEAHEYMALGLGLGKQSLRRPPPVMSRPSMADNNYDPFN